MPGSGTVAGDSAAVPLTSSRFHAGYTDSDDHNTTDRESHRGGFGRWGRPQFLSRAQWDWPRQGSWDYGAR